MPRDPHRDQPVLLGGAPLAEAAGALVLLHGRGGSTTTTPGPKPSQALSGRQRGSAAQLPNHFVNCSEIPCTMTVYALIAPTVDAGSSRAASAAPMAATYGVSAIPSPFVSTNWP